MHAKFELEPVIRDMAAKQVTVFMGVPTMFLGIMNYPALRDVDLTSLK